MTTLTTLGVICTIGGTLLVTLSRLALRHELKKVLRGPHTVDTPSLITASTHPSAQELATRTCVNCGKRKTEHAESGQCLFQWTRYTEWSLETAKAAVERAVYDATGVFEDLEHQGFILGNGHHARQLVAMHAIEELEHRWIKER